MVIPDWAADFRPFSWLHLFSLAWTLPPIVVACWLGRRWLRTGQAHLEARLARVWSLVALGVYLWSQLYWNLPTRFDLRLTIPVQPCDLGGLLAAIALVSGWRWSRTLLYFVGLGLSSIAFLVPEPLREGVGEANYYLYWVGHLAIVGTAIYDCAVRRYRPTDRDFAGIAVFGVIYLASMVALNHALDANYAFVGRTDLHGTPMEVFGPWPERIFVTGAIFLGVWWAMWYLPTRTAKPSVSWVRAGAGWIGAIAFVAGAGLAWLRAVPAMVGFLLFAVGGIVALVAGGASWIQHARGGRLGRSALPATAAGFAFLAITIATAGAPGINDYTTDLEEPPVFAFAAEQAPGAGRNLTYPSHFAESQRQCCSDLNPLVVAGSPPDVLERAKRIAEMNGWELTYFSRETGRLEAVATTPWFGFRDDIAVRVRSGPPGQSRVDMRSKSRDGTGDTGTNARRIRAFLAQLQTSGAESAVE